GRSFIPLLSSYACAIPGILATRTIEHPRDRLTTILVAPLMSCSARLPVYLIVIGALFGHSVWMRTGVLFGMYALGTIAAFVIAMILKRSLLKGPTTPFIMELPPYRMPRLRDVMIQAWNRLKGFVFGAGKIIVIVVMALSVLNSVGTDGSLGNEDSEKSVLSAIGRAIVPAFRPIGLSNDNWPAAVGIFTGVFAKEAVVGTLDKLYSGLDKAETPVAAAETTEDEGFDLIAGLGEAVVSIKDNFAEFGSFFTDPIGLGVVGTAGDNDAAAEAQGVDHSTFGAMAARFDGQAGAFAYLLFILLYFPCAAALGAVAGEVGSRWAVFAAAWTTGVAYFGATLFYQLATFAAHPTTSVLWIGGMTAAMAAAIVGLRRAGRGEARPQFTAAE
ncbi:MAG: ferrous iron transporter B, partial [Hyphomicrobiales bacterium]|nr:ferrous iron transporter B [Hyphomicrobiales bacterium]